MTKTKQLYKIPDQRPARYKEWPVVVYFWTFGLVLLGYLIGRIALDSYPHPYHWVSGLVAGIIGFGLGWVWFRFRGDII